MTDNPILFTSATSTLSTTDTITTPKLHSEFDFPTYLKTFTEKYVNKHIYVDDDKWRSKYLADMGNLINSSHIPNPFNVCLTDKVVVREVVLKVKECTHNGLPGIQDKVIDQQTPKQVFDRQATRIFFDIKIKCVGENISYAGFNNVIESDFDDEFTLIWQCLGTTIYRAVSSPRGEQLNTMFKAQGTRGLHRYNHSNLYPRRPYISENAAIQSQLRNQSASIGYATGTVSHNIT